MTWVNLVAFACMDEQMMFLTGDQVSLSCFFRYTLGSSIDLFCCIFSKVVDMGKHCYFACMDEQMMF